MQLFYDYENKNPLTNEQLKFLITSPVISDLTSWTIVCKYIMKMRLDDWHYASMKHAINNKRTLTMAPRGLGKSYLLTTSYVLFKTLKYRNIRIGVVSANFTSAQAFSQELKQYFEEDMSPIWSIFGDLKGDKWSGSKFSVKRDKIYKEQTVSCYSMQSTNAMGTHMDEWIFDDIVSELNSDTQQKRAKLKNRFFNVFEKAVVQSGPKEFHIIGTPWHQDDFYSFIIKNPVMSKKYKPLILPAIISSNGQERSICEWQLSYSDLLEAKELDMRSFKMQYMMQYTTGVGGLFKAEDINYFHNCYIEDGQVYITKIKDVELRDNVDIYNEEEIEKIKIESVWIGCDLASASKDKSDDMVIAVMGVDKLKNIYLLDLFVGKPVASAIMTEIHKMYSKWYMAKRIAIESNAFQKFLFDLVNEQYTMPTKKIINTKSKYDRFYQFSAEFEKHKVFIKKPYNTPDTVEKRIYNSNYYKLEDQMLNFTDGKDGSHDDVIDAFCMAFELYLNEIISTAENQGTQYYKPGTFSF